MIHSDGHHHQKSWTTFQACALVSAWTWINQSLSFKNACRPDCFKEVGQSGYTFFMKPFFRAVIVKIDCEEADKVVMDFALPAKRGVFNAQSSFDPKGLTLSHDPPLFSHTYYVCPSPYFSKSIRKTKQTSMKVMFTTDVIVGMAEWIINDPYLLSAKNYLYQAKR